MKKYVDEVQLSEQVQELELHSTDTSNPHKTTLSQVGGKTETWTFTLEDGSTVTKNVVVT